MTNNVNILRTTSNTCVCLSLKSACCWYLLLRCHKPSPSHSRSHSLNDKQPEVVDQSVWKVLGKKMSSWSLPKSRKEEFQRQFDQYLAVESDVESEDSNSSTLSQLLGE